MRVDLAQMAKRAGKKRDAKLPPIEPTKAQADDLYRIYVQVPRLVATFTKERLIPAYERALAQATSAKDALVRDDIPELERELGFLDVELRRLVLNLTPQMRRLILRMESWQRKRWVQNVLTATGVNLETLIGPEDVREPMAASLARNVDLITDLSREARSKTADAIWRGYQARSPARVVAKDIQAAMEISRKRAVRIASHQTQVLSMTLDQERQTQAGITEYIWRHSRKAHPRQEHLERDGQLFKWSKPPADGPPGTLPFCGCRAQAHLVL